MRNLSRLNEGGVPPRGSNYVGNIFFGNQGYVVVDPRGFQIFLGDLRETTHEDRILDSTPHMKNFLDAVRSRNRYSPNADIQIGASTAVVCHLGNHS